jgi:hypothetical protein
MPNNNTRSEGGMEVAMKKDFMEGGSMIVKLDL